MIVAYEDAARRLRFQWYGVMVFGVPLASAAALATMYFVDAPLLNIGHELALSAAQFWTAALLLMIAGVCGSGLLGRYALVPHRIARASIPATVEAPQDPVSRAEALVRAAIFMPLGMLDTPAVLLLIYGLVSGDLMAPALAMVYCLVSGVVMEPDMKRLVQQTVAAMQEGDTAR